VQPAEDMGAANSKRLQGPTIFLSMTIVKTQRVLNEFHSMPMYLTRHYKVNATFGKVKIAGML